MEPPATQNLLIAELEQQREMLRRKQEQDALVLNALYTISLACRDKPTYREIFQVIYHELAQVFYFDACYIALCDMERPDVFRAALMVDEGEQAYEEGDHFSALSARILHNRETLLFRDLLIEWHQSSPLAETTMFGSPKRSRAWLGVPLMIGPQAVGVISIQSYEVGVYDTQTRDLLQRMVNVIAVALENVRLFEREQQLSRALSSQVADRTAELAALSELAAAIVIRHPLAEFLERALAITLDLFDLPSGNVRLLDAEREFLVLAAARGFAEPYLSVTSRSRLATSPIRTVVLEQRPQVIERGWYAMRDAGTFPITVFPPFEASLSVPLAIGATVLGTLTLFGIEPRAFPEHEVDLAQVMANQIAVVVENTRLLEEHERQIAELRALSRISLAASTARDVRSLLAQVHDALAAAVPLDAFSMVVYDPEREVVSDGISIDEGQTYDHWSNQAPPPSSLTAWVIGRRTVLRFADLPAEIGNYPELQSYVVGVDRPARSWLGVPLIDRDGRAIGMIALQSYTAARYGERDEAFMRGVAAQVSLHVQNVALLAQRERQICELDVIGQIGQLVTASYDFDEILTGVYTMVSGLTGASVFFLLICEPQSREITHAVFVEEGQSVDLQVVGGKVQAGSLSDWILTQREPLLFTDLAEQRKGLQARGITPIAIGPANPVRSWAGVPLVARSGELIGVLALQDYRPFRYDAQTIDFLNQVASHVSLGVQKVRLFEERKRQALENARLAVEAHAHAEAAERQAQRMKLVHRITALLNTRLNEREIFDIASQEIAQLFAADHTGTVAFDEDLIQGTVISEHPSAGAIGAPISLRDSRLVEELLLTRRPVIIDDTAIDPRAAASRETFYALGITSLAVIPLISRDRLIGSISLDSYHEPVVYSAADQELMLTVANSIAAAIENARLFAAEQEARRTADTLREIARVIGSSFDPAEVLRMILGELRKVIVYDTASIMLIDNDQLRIAAAQGWALDEDPVGLSYPVEGSAAGMVARSGHPQVYSDLAESWTWVQTRIGSHVRSWLGVPLMVRGRALGVLNIDSRSSRHFTDRDMAVALSFANHAAVALENAQLYQESVTRVEQEMEIARNIQRNLFPRSLSAPEGMVVAATCVPARETGGDFYDVITLGEGRVGVIVGDVSGKSLPAAMLMAVARSAARAEARNHEVPAVVLIETNRWLVDDVPPHTFVALGYAALDLRAGRLALASGGQLTPLQRKVDGAVHYLEAPGPLLPLGIVREVAYQQLEADLAPGDTLVFYTDGIVEARNRAGQLFGFERLEELIYRHGDLPPTDLINLLLAAVHAFTGDMPQHDDMTLVVVSIEH